MKKFTFKLASLLTVRDWEEQRAQQRLGEANLRVAMLERRIAEIRDGKSAALSSWTGSTRDRFTAADRLMMNAQVADTERELRKAEAALVEAHEAKRLAMLELETASRGKKVVQNLKDRRYEEFRAEAYRQEANEVEDIFNARRSAS